MMAPDLTVKPSVLCCGTKAGDILLESRYGEARELACMLRLIDALKSDRAVLNVMRRVYCDTPHDEAWVYLSPVHGGTSLHEDLVFRMGNRIAALIWAFDGPGNVFIEDLTRPKKNWSFVKQPEDNE